MGSFSLKDVEYLKEFSSVSMILKKKFLHITKNKLKEFLICYMFVSNMLLEDHVHSIYNIIFSVIIRGSCSSAIEFLKCTLNLYKE